MNDVSILLLIFGFWGLVVGGAVVLAVRFSRKANAMVRRLATELGLSVREPEPLWGVFPRQLQVEGEREGKATRIVRFTTGSGKHRQHWFALAVRPRVRGRLEFRLSPEGFGNTLRGLFGYKEIKLGDPRFDAAWYVETNQEEFLREALVPELRERLQHLRSEGLKGRFETHDNEVRYVERGALGSDAQRRRVVLAADMVSTLAEVVEVAAG